MDHELLNRMRALIESGDGMSVTGQRKLLEEYDRTIRAMEEIAKEAGKVWDARADAVNDTLIHRLALSVLPNYVPSGSTAFTTPPHA
jgi:hypothetical protein